MPDFHERIHREELYNDALKLMKNKNIADYEKAIEMLQMTNGYDDSEKRIRECSILLNEAKRKAAFKKRLKIILTCIFAPIAIGITVYIIYMRSLIFPEVDGMEFKLIDDEYVLKDYEGSKTRVNIPSEVKNSPVTEINGAFSGCKKLRTVNIPETIIKIGNNSFSNCDKLRRITLPDSVTEIGSGAFYSCDNLERIFIPESVTFIDEDAFQDCNKLTIICSESSYARAYAEKYNIDFKTK